jgi:hypothetical protein
MFVYGPFMMHKASLGDGLLDRMSYKLQNSDNSFFIDTSVAYVVGPSVNPLQNKGTQHVNIVLQCMY